MTTPSPVRVTADLRFSIEMDGHAPVSGTVTGSGSRFEVRLSDPAYFAGGRDAGHLRDLAARLAQYGVTVVVIAGDVVLLEVGATRPPWWQRVLTGSRHLKVASPRGAWTGAVGRVRGSTSGAVLPGRELLPPATLFPIAPTFAQRSGPVTTTHDPRGGGNPRLALTAGNPGLPADGRLLFPLRGAVTTIGSGPECDVRLEGLASLQASIERDERDEMILVDRTGDGTTLLNGQRVEKPGRVLRTGARLSLGEWTLVYRRAEFADHGRPFGGRVGGELGRQRSQPAVAAPTGGGRAAP